MTVYIGDVKYVPGTYAKKKPSAAELAEQCILGWEEKRLEGKKKEDRLEKIPPAVCFSRKIGVGALEIADILAEKLGYYVVDREILEHIAHQAGLSEKTVELFDERYAGKLNEFLMLILGEKSFIQSDYSRILSRTVLSIAGLGPTIFVGRGTHLLLPRDRVLAVRFIASRNHRAKRLAAVLGVPQEEADRKIADIDREQKEFFKKVYGKSDARAYEFDMVINLDYLPDPQWSAEIVAFALRQKFGPDMETL